MSDKIIELLAAKVSPEAAAILLGVALGDRQPPCLPQEVSQLEDAIEAEVDRIQTHTVKLQAEVERLTKELAATPKGWNLPKSGDKVRLAAIPKNSHILQRANGDRLQVGDELVIAGFAGYEDHELIGETDQMAQMADNLYWPKRQSAAVMVYEQGRDAYWNIPLRCLEPV